MAGQIPVQQSGSAQNPSALVSLVCSLIGIFFPPLVIFISALTGGQVIYEIVWWIGPFSLAPSLLGIIFGYIGQHRARHNSQIYNTLDMAKTGMAIGYIFGSIYLVFLLCMLSVLFTMYT